MNGWEPTAFGKALEDGDSLGVWMDDHVTKTWAALILDSRGRALKEKFDFKTPLEAMEWAEEAAKTTP